MKFTKYMMTISAAALLIGTHVEAAGAGAAGHPTMAELKAYAEAHMKYGKGDFEGNWNNRDTQTWAQYNLGQIAQKAGYIDAAREWYSKAAARGHADAQACLKRLGA